MKEYLDACCCYHNYEDKMASFHYKNWREKRRGFQCTRAFLDFAHLYYTNASRCCHGFHVLSAQLFCLFGSVWPFCSPVPCSVAVYHARSCEMPCKIWGLLAEGWQKERKASMLLINSAYCYFIFFSILSRQGSLEVWFNGSLQHKLILWTSFNKGMLQ